jgi:hypothetical protein
VIFNNDRRCGRSQLALFHAMLVPVHDERVMTQQTMAADFDMLVCRNRRAVVDESMIAYRDTSTRVTDEFKRNNVSDQGQALAKFHLAGTFETNATDKPYRKWYSRPSSYLKLRIDERYGKARITNNFQNVPEQRSVVSYTSRRRFKRFGGHLRPSFAINGAPIRVP